MDEIGEKLERELINQLKSAYKKYKNSIYYDNYSSIQRLKLSKFEIVHSLNDNDSYFEEIARKLIELDNFDELIDDICNNIDVIAFPKKMDVDEDINKHVIRNYNKDTNEIEKLYYFIDLPILGHILGVLWILRCGYVLDDKLYKNCYGNRLNNNLLSNLKNKKSEYYIKNEKLDLTPSLFKPYYKNYESWRDNGLDNVDVLLKNEKHAMMISMDLKEYYYRSLIDFVELKQDLKDTHKKINEKYNYDEKIWDLRINEILTDFIEKVFKKYSSKFKRTYKFESLNQEKIYHNEYPMIPLGFLPSLIISNWYLQGFDQAIVENVRPQYYGRYVDDILIVLGIHEKSESHGLQQFDELSNSELIKKYLTPHNYPKIKLFNIVNENSDNDDCEIIYKIHNQCFKNAKGNEITYIYDALEVQDKKFQTYYFSHNYSNAIIQNFKEEIRKNSSEFRLMHDLNSIIVDFRENLYRINYVESINKLRDIRDVDINKFEISKILSRINWVSSDTTDILDEEIVKYLIAAFKGKLFEFIALWEKIFSMLLINNRYDELSELIEYIQSKISKLKFNPNLDSSYVYYMHDKDDIDVIKESLRKFLKSSLIRVFSLKNNDNVVKIIKKCYNKNLNDLTSMYLRSSMQNNSLMKYPIRDVSEIAENLYVDENFEFNLITADYDDSGIYDGLYYPRFVKLHECILDYLDKDIHDISSPNELEIFKENGDNVKVTITYPNFYFSSSLSNLDNYFLSALYRYQVINFGTFNAFPYIEGECGLNCKNDKYCPINKYAGFKDIKIIKTPGNTKNSLKIGLLNTRLDALNFEKRLLCKSNLSSERFDKIKLLINDAIRKNVDLLVMPEMYIPYEWVEKIVKISKDHQMAIIFGVGPIGHDNKIGNYIMAALPFVLHDNYYECALVYRLKNHYAPSEIKQIREYGKVIKTFDDIEKYHMYIWNGIHIVPYYCYEISSIEDRSIFKSCCDIVTISEFNKDTKYFDNIAESLSRDLFCYCIKSNTSEFGGSSVIQPTSSEKKYLVKLKGGDDDYIVTHELDIAKLRKYSQKLDIGCNHNFKPKPAGYSYHIAKKRK